MKHKTNEMSEIVVFSGYDVDDVMDTSNDFEDEEPIGYEEVKIKFEQ